MSKPSFHGIRRAIPASVVRQTLGDALSQIRQDKRLTWGEIGEVVGKSEDQAAKYADGSATMDVVAYTNARVAWNGEFTGGLDSLIDEARREQDPREAESCILKAALALSIALTDDKLTLEEIRANRATLECAHDAISAILQRLNPREVRR